MSNAHIEVIGLEGQKQTAAELIDSIGERPVAIQFARGVLSIDRIGIAYILDSEHMPEMIDRIFTPEVNALIKVGHLYAARTNEEKLPQMICADRGMAIMIVELFGEGQVQAQVIGEYELYGA